MIGETWVGDHHGSEMQCHVALEALEAADAEPGHRVIWSVEDGNLVGRIDRDAE